MALRTFDLATPPMGRRRSRLALTMAAIIVAAFLGTASAAFGAQASSGQLLFYPCTTCHPVSATGQPLHPLPNNFKGHEIVLAGHDILGKGPAACMACHDDPTRNPGMLKTVDGSLVDVANTAQIPQVCRRCHSDKYDDWLAGTHGKHKPSCTSQGCHDPHTPKYMFAAALTPFVGTGFQFRAVDDRQPFMPLAPPAPDPAVVYPWWIGIMAALGFVTAGVLVGRLFTGRSKR